METTPGLTHNAAGPKGACPRDSWPYVFLFSSQGKRKPAGILIYKTSYILVIIPSVATYATNLVTCLFYKNSQCHLDTLPPPALPNFVYNASKFSFLSLQAQMVSKVSWSIIARITKSLRFYIGDGVGKGWGTGHYFFAQGGSGDNRRFVGKSSSYVWGKLPSRLQNYSKCILYVNFHYVFQELVKHYSWYVIHAGNHIKRRNLKFVLF